jgi:hypothetical protein
MNSEILNNELFIKIKKLISEDKDILDKSIGESNFAEILSLTEKDFPVLRKLSKLWLVIQEEQKDEIVWDVAAIAWRAAAFLNITEAIRLMLDILEESEKLKIDTDLIATDLAHSGEMTDKAAIAFLCDFIQTKSYDDWTIISAVECLGYSLKNTPDMKNIIKEAMARRFIDFENNSSNLNAFLIDKLTELEAVELAETMEKAFAAGKVDESHIGIWEDTRRELRVQGMGLVPDGKRVTPDPMKDFVKNLEILAAQNSAEEQKLKKKLNKKKKQQRKNLKKLRKLKRQRKR